MLRLIIIYILFNSLISVWILNIYKDDMLISNFNGVYEWSKDIYI